MLETGHIPEKVYDALGFPKDEVSGVVYDRNDGIEIEWIQRAKIINPLVSTTFEVSKTEENRR